MGARRVRVGERAIFTQFITGFIFTRQLKQGVKCVINSKIRVLANYIQHVSEEAEETTKESRATDTGDE